MPRQSKWDQPQKPATEPRYNEMFSCRACLRRAVGPLLESPATAFFESSLPRRPPPQLTRRLATLPSATRAPVQGAPAPSQRLKDAGQDADPDLDTITGKKKQQKLRHAVRKHLEHMHDSFTIAKHVERTLRKNPERFEETLLLVQTASKDQRCTVAWNHLIDHQLQAQRLRTAVRLFNDMKKRAQRPDAHTYTVLFRGFALSPHRELAVSEAIRLFRAMRRHPGVKPNIIHLNAVLHVCARAGDIDTMFTLVDEVLHDGADGDKSSMNKKDKLVPTAQTYTAILQGLRSWALNPEVDAEGSSTSEADGRIKEMVEHSRSVWEEVMRSWRGGSLALDEQLVGAMGRNLLYDKKAGPRDVLALLEQTMGIPRLDTQESTRTKPKTDQGMAGPPSSTASKSRKKAASQPPKPGLNTLSLVLTALAEVRLVTAAVRYWDHLVRDGGIEPDAKLWEQMIRLLHLGRSSAEVARVLSAAPPTIQSPYLFRTALSACFRDLRNPNVVDNASTIVEAMVRGAGESGNRVPDAKALWMYLEVPQRRARVEASLSGQDATASGVDVGQSVELVNRVWDPYVRASKAALFPQLVETRRPKMIKNARMYGELVEVVELARELLSLTAQIARTGDSIDAETRRVMEKRRDSLNRQVVIFTELREELEGMWRKEPENAEVPTEE
ncbi:hypothetical protein ACRALDRAFT_1083282 [Sodiomyces alcalophilus JCM 7366]|uniref:uncharacterized protein n=1 Tax=Sodiomyces alcalophilus JCM 7366 TaxID=591952 RepID=UPI0039B5A7DD